LVWLPVLDDEWGVVIWRFCSVPRPLPERSEVVNIPPQWLAWRATQEESTGP